MAPINLKQIVLERLTIIQTEITRTQLTWLKIIEPNLGTQTELVRITICDGQNSEFLDSDTLT